MHETELTHLFKCRLVVARIGEMDNARWWNTQGLLGKLGETTLKRGFPVTHHFAQAKAVFAVAEARCCELFQPPEGYWTLWNLPAEVEGQFEEKWHEWLDQGTQWRPFFERVQTLSAADVAAGLEGLELIGRRETDFVRKLRRSNELRSVLISGLPQLDGFAVSLLAAAFSLSEPGKPAIPYTRIGGDS